MDYDDPNGAQYREPLFKGENYHYQKENMYVYLMLVDKHIWVAGIDEPFISKNEVDDYIKLPKDWTINETKKTSYNLNAINIHHIFALSVKIYYSI